MKGRSRSRPSGSGGVGEVGGRWVRVVCSVYDASCLQCVPHASNLDCLRPRLLQRLRSRRFHLRPRRFRLSASAVCLEKLILQRAHLCLRLEDAHGSVSRGQARKWADADALLRKDGQEQGRDGQTSRAVRRAFSHSTAVRAPSASASPSCASADRRFRSTFSNFASAASIASLCSIACRSSASAALRSASTAAARCA